MTVWDRGSLVMPLVMPFDDGPRVSLSPPMVDLPSWVWVFVAFQAVSCLVAVAVAFYAVGRSSR